MAPLRLSAPATPLDVRLAAVLVARAALVAAVLVGLVVAADAFSIPAVAVLAGLVAYVVVAVAPEAWRRRGDRRGDTVVAAGLVADAAAIGALIAVTGGTTSPLLLLAELYVVAVTLALSASVGLQMAIGCALAIAVGVAAMATWGPPGGAPLAPGDAVRAGGTFFAFVVCAAAFAALDERALRDAGERAASLAALASALDDARDVVAVRRVAERSIAEGWPTGRVAVVATDPSEVVPEATGLWRDARTPERLLVAAALPEARDVVVVPLRDEGRTVGLLAVEWRGRGGHRRRRGASSGAGPTGEGAPVTRRRPPRIEASAVASLEQAGLLVAAALRAARLLDELARQAQHDPLTGLLNRRALDDRVPPLLAQAARAGTPLAVVLIDLDRFKAINDEAGHLVGDAVLAGVAAAVVRHLRGADLAARFGGEELLLVLPDTDHDGGREVAERVRAEIAADVVRPDGTPVTASAGVAAFPVDGASLDVLVKAADDALYAAKAAGRDCVVVACGSTELRVDP